jgi:hypothetical protein
VLNTVQFTTGISVNVFGALQHSVQKITGKDHYCVLMFDEMSVRENVCFNQKLGCIEGFEDLVKSGQTCNVANHALVFMVRGLYKKWKQSMAYYFTHASTKAEMLLQFLEEVIDACQNAGLKVVATICDMGSNNVKALKLLKLSEEQPFFKFHNKESAAVFDPPHLLKRTHNLFRT